MTLVCKLFFQGVPPAVASHPPHLKERSSASAFIPFCAFEGQLIEPLIRLPNLSFPICKSFTPTFLEGQLCYKLKMNRTTKGSENREGLLLILDLNEDLNLKVDSLNNTMSQNNSSGFSSNLMTSTNKNSGKIHINTLSSFKAFGSGSYRMTSVKKLKGTSAFLAMSNVDKKCTPEDHEECRRRSLFEKCQCVPWDFGYIQVLRCKKKYCIHIFIGGASLFSRGQRVH